MLRPPSVENPFAYLSPEPTPENEFGFISHGSILVTGARQNPQQQPKFRSDATRVLSRPMPTIST